jgi:hypothetical protein
MPTAPRRKHPLLGEYMALAGTNTADYQHDLAGVEAELDKLRLSEAAEAQLLSMAYAAAYAIRSQNETAICNRARKRVRKIPLSPYPPLEDIWKRHPELAPRDRAWAWQSDRLRREKVMKLADMAWQTGVTISEVVRAPSFRPLLPEGWFERVETSGLAQSLTDLGEQMKQHLKTYRAPRKERSEMRVRMQHELIKAFEHHTGTKHLRLIARLLTLFTAGVSKATLDSLTQDERVFANLDRRPDS